MKVRLRNIFLLVATVLLLYSCREKDDAAPQAPSSDGVRGSITGRVLPHNSSIDIKAISTANKTFATVANSNGYFTITGLPQGKYAINVKPKPGYVAPFDMFPVSVTRGSNNQVGNIYLERKSYLKYLVNDTTISAAQPMYGSLLGQAPLLYLTSTEVWVSHTSHLLELYVPQFRGAGIYQLDSASGNYGIYSRGEAKWRSTNGSLHITYYNTETRLVSGTFSLVTTPVNPLASGSKSLSNGEFEDFYIAP